MSENKQLEAISKMINTKVLKHENILILLIITAVLMKYLNVQHGGIITTVILSLSAIVYYLSAFPKHEEEGLAMYDIFAFKMSAISSAVTVIGILFSLLRWPNAKPMTIVGGVTILACLIYMLIQKKNRPNLKLFNNSMILRIIVLIIISAGLMLEVI